MECDRSPPFYVASTQDLSEDKEYLKEILWPAFEGLYVHEDVRSFWSTVNQSQMLRGGCEQISNSKNMEVHRPCTTIAESTVQVPGGEGRCELGVHTEDCPPSFKWLVTNVEVGLWLHVQVVPGKELRGRSVKAVDSALGNTGLPTRQVCAILSVKPFYYRSTCKCVIGRVHPSVHCVIMYFGGCNIVADP